MDAHVDEVRARGFTVIKGMISPDLCAQLRGVADHIFGAEASERATAVPVGFREGEHPQFIDPHNSEAFDIDTALRAGQSVVGTRNYRHGVRHPIIAPNSGAILAEAAVAGEMLALQERLLHAGSGLRLMQQQLVRSDPDPQAIEHGSHPVGWHMVSNFCGLSPQPFGSVRILVLRNPCVAPPRARRNLTLR